MRTGRSQLKSNKRGQISHAMGHLEVAIRIMDIRTVLAIKRSMKGDWARVSVI